MSPPAPRGGEAALALAGVSVRLGGRPVLHAVDLSLAPGEVLVLAGSNGAGKTTLLRAAAGLLPLAAGSVHVAGRAARELGRRALARQLAFVPQDVGVPFPFSVREVVLMGRAPHLPWLGFETRRDRALADAAIERLGLGALAGRSLLALSGGERQLVLVARALAQDTPLLLLDEPSAHLDLRRRLELLELLRALAAEGRAVLLVTHDLALAARAGERVALLAEGRLLAAGPVAEVVTPARLRAAFGVEAEVVDTSAGPVVVPTRAAPGVSR